MSRPFAGPPPCATIRAMRPFSTTMSTFESVLPRPSSAVEARITVGASWAVTAFVSVSAAGGPGGVCAGPARGERRGGVAAAGRGECGRSQVQREVRRRRLERAHAGGPRGGGGEGEHEHRHDGESAEERHDAPEDTHARSAARHAYCSLGSAETSFTAATRSSPPVKEGTP